MQPVEILDEVIEEYESGRMRWRQYGPNDTGMGGRCVSQAIWYVQQKHNETGFVAYMAAQQAVREHMHYPSVIAWNDDPQLTFSVMLDTLKTVADRLRTNT